MKYGVIVIFVFMAVLMTNFMEGIRLRSQDKDALNEPDSLRRVEKEIRAALHDTLTSELITDTVHLDNSVPRPIPDFLSPDLFIPRSSLVGLTPWISAPILRPVVYVIPVAGFNGSIGFGEYSLSHPDKFFSTLNGYNSINIPQMYITQQMMIGNTFRLARGFYMMSGIMYGAQLGVMGNNWGLGNREGFIWQPTPILSIVIWNQYFQSLSVYSPIVYPTPDGAAVKMPATPEVFSFGVQASFVVGEFIIGVGTSITPHAK